MAFTAYSNPDFFEALKVNEELKYTTDGRYCYICNKLHFLNEFDTILTESDELQVNRYCGESLEDMEKFNPDIAAHLVAACKLCNISVMLYSTGRSERAALCPLNIKEMSDAEYNGYTSATGGARIFMIDKNTAVITFKKW